MARKFKLWREHYLNVLHIYCRVMDIGFSRKNAVLVAKILCWPKI